MITTSLISFRSFSSLMCFIIGSVFVLVWLKPCYSDNFKIERIGPRLEHPWGMAVVNDTTILVTTRPGKLFSFDLKVNNQNLIKNVPAVYEHRQGGLLDVAVRIEDEEPTVFLCYTKRKKSKKLTTAIYRAKLVNHSLLEGKDIFISNTESSSGLHFGCRIALDGNFLFASLGDRGNRHHAQDPAIHAGSIIRLDLDERLTPNRSQLNWRKEIYSIGHRNPQGLVFHPSTGELWAHEHGPRGGDEINIIQKYNNYGWPTVSYGKEYIGGDIGLNYSPAGYVDPIWKWDPSIAPSGIAFYYGGMFQELNNKLLVGSLKFMRLYVLTLDSNNKPVSETTILNNSLGRIRDIEILRDGSILILNDEENGGLFKLFRQP